MSTYNCLDFFLVDNRPFCTKIGGALSKLAGRGVGFWGKSQY